MKRTQSRVAKAIVEDYLTLSKTLSKKVEILETLSKKYSISTKTVQRILKKDNVSVKKDNVSVKKDNVPCSTEHKYRIKSTAGYLTFEDETGREIRGDDNYTEWQTAYERAIDSGAILF